MGASRDKKIRRELGSVDKGASTAAEEKRKKKTRTIAIAVVLVVVIAFAGGLYVNSGHIRAHTTGIEVGDMRFSPAEFSYFYNNVYSEYYITVYSSFGDSASYMLPQRDVPLDSQYYDEAAGRTWADFFEESTISMLRESVPVYRAAEADGFVLTQEQVDEVDAELSSLDEIAKNGGYKNAGAYLAANYGKGVNAALLRKCVLFEETIRLYKEHVRESFVYTPEEIRAAYEKNKDSLDLYTYRYFQVVLGEYDAAEHGGDEEAAKQAALADALARAQAYADGIESEQDMIDAARDYNAETYETDDASLRYYSGSYLGTFYGDWMKDAGRQNGDVTAVGMDNGAYVVYYIGRESNNYNMVDARQILVTPNTVNQADYTDEAGELDQNAYDAAVRAAEEAALARAEEALQKLEEAGASEEALVDLMSAYSADTAEGGLYEDVNKATQADGSQYIIPALNWLFETGRQVGDYTLIESEYGYHIVYMSAFGGLYKDYLADNKLRTDAYSGWENAFDEPTYEKKAFLKLSR